MNEIKSYVCHVFDRKGKLLCRFNAIGDLLSVSPIDEKIGSVFYFEVPSNKKKNRIRRRRGKRVKVHKFKRGFPHHICGASNHRQYEDKYCCEMLFRDVTCKKCLKLRSEEAKLKGGNEAERRFLK